MGIGCVLLFWAVAWAVVGAIGAALLVWFAGRTGGSERRARVRRWIFIALPSAAAYAPFAFACYWATCIARGVDPGIGDVSRVPLVQDYSLDFVDTLEEAFISPPSPEAASAGISVVKQVGSADHHVFGLAEKGWFLIDTRNGKVEVIDTEAGLVSRLAELGIANPSITPVEKVYFAKRWGWPDLVVPLALAVPAILVVGRTLRRAWAGSASVTVGAVA